MDTYLDIAAKVLEAVRKPLSAKQLLNSAYMMRIVPPHLHGRTQHKTLHARIAEDILIRRHRSKFVRTQPGRFLLRSLLTDPTVPEEFKSEFPAPRRAEQLQNFSVLCCKQQFETISPSSVNFLNRSQARAFLNPLPLEYQLLSDVLSRTDLLFFRTMTIILRDFHFLMSRSYTRQSNEFGGPKSAGLFSYVTDSDRTLFSKDSYGFGEAAKRSLTDQAAMTDDLIEDADGQLRDIGVMIGGAEVPAATAVYVYECKPGFDPVERNPYKRMFSWQNPAIRPNRSDDFDRCSEFLLTSGLLRSITYESEPKAHKDHRSR